MSVMELGPEHFTKEEVWALLKTRYQAWHELSEENSELRFRLEAVEKRLLRIADMPEPVIETVTGDDITVRAIKEEVQRALSNIVL